MTQLQWRSFWSVFAVGAATGYFAAIAIEPQPLSAAPEVPNGIPNRLTDVENQLAELQDQIGGLPELQSRVAELQHLLGGLLRGEDGEFMFLDPVVVDQPSSDLALHVSGTVIEAGGALPVAQPTLLVAGKTELNNGEEPSGIPSVNVVGYLTGDVLESDLLLCDELHAAELASSRVVESDILTCSDTALFTKTLFVDRDGTLKVEGTLDARTAEVRLPPDGN